MTNNLKWLFVSQQSLTQSLFFLNGTAVFDDVAIFFLTEVRFFHLFPFPGEDPRYSGGRGWDSATLGEVWRYLSRIISLFWFYHTQADGNGLV